MKVNIGKNTLGDSDKMSLSLKEYGRSTHDLSFAWRSTMGVGTLVPSLKMVALPGDTFEIGIESKILTVPTTGPLFGSFKFQTDIFTCPIRLYNALLHNNALNIGLDMKQVKFPVITNTGNDKFKKYSEALQFNPTGLIYNLGLKGFSTIIERDGTSYNIMPFLMYYDIFKNYYANKQEKEYYQFLTKKYETNYALGNAIGRFSIGKTLNVFFLKEGFENDLKNSTVEIEQSSGRTETLQLDIFNDSIYFTKNTITTAKGERYIDYRITQAGEEALQKNELYKNVDEEYFNIGEEQWEISLSPETLTSEAPNKYNLEEIDKMREYILSQGRKEIRIDIKGEVPKELQLISRLFDENAYTSDNSGLIIKTHMSDIFNNWINTETISGSNGISELTKVNTSQGFFTIDSLNLAKKVYEMLNRIAVSGGSYKDWIETVYTTDYYFRAETPVYEGGLSSEIVFDEVVSQSANTETNEPLGTLAGRGISVNQKGGNVIIKVNEPCYIIALSSITPRVDYSTGNDWDLISLHNMDNLHKPQLDGIGFQDLIAEKMCWGAYRYSLGKQPAWLDYMTNYNKTAGKFAVGESQSFMVLNKIYNNGKIEADDSMKAGFTTYIRPSEFNYIFAESDDAAHNFWVQLGYKIEARRVMSAKEMPNP